jgi:2-polyprenyl-6-hydroxyphenyl methylase/3-demethylubiquinone-9 3-methyltransferase
MNQSDVRGYRYDHAICNCSHAYLLPELLEILEDLKLPRERRRVFDLGCGNGSVAALLAGRGFEVVGVDPSADGLEQARKAYPQLKLFSGSAYDDLAGRFGRFPIVISLEVVEHVFYPRKFAACVHSLLEPGGTAILSTPYHGYLKNLALSVSGKLDEHFTALWDDGHIKFWSKRTLGDLLGEAGFAQVAFRRVGRFAPLAKSMIATTQRGSA